MVASASAQKTTDDDYHTSDSLQKDTKVKEKIPFSERLVYGGNLGLWIGSFNYIQVNPMVGYKVTDWWAVGPGFNYTYFGNRTANINYYGPSVWTRIRPLEGFYLHTEFSSLTTNYYDKAIPVWLVGGGVVARGDFASIALFLMYDIVQNENSPYYGSLLPSGGLLIGF
ncbi:MAG: hypothetical protein ACKVOK_02090 [Flavobacteriales bacterium]